MTETTTTTLSRLNQPSPAAAQARPQARTRLDESNADIFLKRSAPYYHAHPPSSPESAHATSKQRDPLLADTLQSLAPPDARFSPASMHARLQTAQQTLDQALAQLKDKSLRNDAQKLQQQINDALTLQQEASDNQRLLIQA